MFFIASVIKELEGTEFLVPPKCPLEIPDWSRSTDKMEVNEPRIARSYA